MTGEAFSARDVKRGLATSVMGCRVRCYRSVASTMDTAQRLAERGAPEGTIVLAEQQARGRGRFNRQWVSPPGLNLTFSVILRPATEGLPYLNMAASVALVEAIGVVTGIAATIKWPNDVRAEGKKVAGVLIEARVGSGQDAQDGGQPIGAGYAVLGVGLNVNHDPTTQLSPPVEATSLAATLGRPVDRLPVLQAFLCAFDPLYLGEDHETLYHRWRATLDTLGQRVRVAWGGTDDGSSAGHTAEEGVAVDVERSGDLVLRRADGSMVSLNAGEVTLLSAASG